ncbi:flavin monoamine oxidase family protein [Rubrobacter taiwanensis]|jgi:monoamine oxidase|nr:NAD(P)/FAD-dependent oxidoreductase [Rubrobacter taiwanensis]
MTAPDVAVVGAGLSGLAAARELVREGLDVLVLEARDRPGGRTGVMEVGGVTVDIGGEWVDAAHSELRGLISELGLKLVPAGDGKGRARWHVGGEFSPEMPLDGGDAAAYDRMQEALADAAEGVDPEACWRFAPGEDLSVEQWLRREGMSERGIHAVETIVSTCGSTVPLRRMSFYAYAVKVAGRGGPGRGNEYRVRGGAGGVARALAGELGERVRYRSPVVEVRQDGGGVALRYVSPDGPGEVRARRAVLALPFTCYRGVSFHPPPPPVFRRMFARATYGVVRKVHFIFGRPVGGAPFTITDTPLGYCCPSQASGGAGGIVAFAGGEVLLPELGLPAAERERRAVRQLRRLYDVPEPEVVVEKVWPHDYWTRGSYMILAPGDLRGFGEAMGGRFGCVYLAGAEGIAAAPSFMNSAVRSGLRAAGKILEEISVPRRSRAGTGTGEV